MQTDNQIDAVERKLTGELRDNVDDLGLPVEFDKDAHIKYPNAPFNTPSNFPWLRTALINNGPISQDASGCYEINSGFFIVTVFYPKGTGSQKALQVGQAIKSLYSAEKFDDVTIESAVVNPVPEVDGDPWYGVNVQMNFTFEGFNS